MGCWHVHGACARVPEKANEITSLMVMSIVVGGMGGLAEGHGLMV